MKTGVLPKLAGVPDWRKLESELRARLERIEMLLNELVERSRDNGTANH